MECELPHRKKHNAADPDPVGEQIVVSLADIRGMDEKARRV